MGVRVYELARTLRVSSKELMHELKKQGIDLKSHMSSIDDETAELVLDLLKAPQPSSMKEDSPPPPVLEDTPEAPVIDSPTAVIEEVVTAPPETATPREIPEPTPSVTVESPQVSTLVEAPPVVSPPVEKRLRLGEAVTVKELAEKLDARPAE